MTAKREGEGKVAGANHCLSQHSPGCNRGEAWMCPRHDERAASGHRQPCCIFAWSTRQSRGAFAQLSQPMQSSTLLQLPLRLAWLRKSNANQRHCRVEQSYNAVSPLTIWAHSLPCSLTSTFSFRAQLHLSLGTVKDEGLSVPGKGCVRDWGVGDVFSQPHIPPNQSLFKQMQAALR